MSPGRLRDPSRRPLTPPAPALDGRVVLVPRTEPRGAALAALLRDRGARVLLAPAITRAPVEDRGPLDDAVRRLAAGAFDWVAVTSVNAVDALTATVDLARLFEESGRPVRWAAVGPATRRALEAAGVCVDLEPEEHSAAGLVAAFAALPSPSSPRESSAPGDPGGSPGADNSARVLLPQGDLATPTLADGLRRLGYGTEVVTAYRTVGHELPDAVRRAWHAGEVDAVVLTSGSVAREIARQLGPRADVAGVAIGEPTARTAREVGLRLDIVAKAATDDALAAALVSALTAPLAGPATARPTALPDSHPRDPRRDQGGPPS